MRKQLPGLSGVQMVCREAQHAVEMHKNSPCLADVDSYFASMGVYQGYKDTEIALAIQAVYIER